MYRLLAPEISLSPGGKGFLHRVGDSVILRGVQVKGWKKSGIPNGVVVSGNLCIIFLDDDGIVVFQADPDRIGKGENFLPVPAEIQLQRTTRRRINFLLMILAFFCSIFLVFRFFNIS